MGLATGGGALPSASSASRYLAPFVPRLLRTWLAEDPASTHRIVNGTLALIDIAGFTQLTERLSARGKVGAEELTEIVDALFTELLELARRDGAYLLKWGGDAVLLLFEGDAHAARAARAAYRMRARLHRFGTARTTSGAVRLRMSVGLHSGELTVFLVGDQSLHRELIVCGPSATRTAQIGAAARIDEIRLSPETAAELPPEIVDWSGSLPLLADAPSLVDVPTATDLVHADDADLTAVLWPSIRDYLLAGDPSAEHRKVAVAFVRFSGTDQLLATEGPERLAAALDECVRLVQHAAQRHGVTFLESDIDQDGGKIMIVSGAPRSGDHDEDRLLRAAQHIVGADPALPLHVGVNRGAVFTGVLGPWFCRAYSVKGDAVNVAARIAAHARPGEALATVATLSSAAAHFPHEPLPPLRVKGKSAPIETARLGTAVPERAGWAEPSGELLAREVELSSLRSAVTAATAGQGALVEVVGEPGIGKSRLVQALLAEVDTPSCVVICDEYETSTPYWPFRALFESVLRLPEGRDARALRDAVRELDAELLCWLPLLARIVDVEVPSTPEVDAIDDRFRQAKLQDVAAQCLTAALPTRMVLVFEDVHLMDDASAGLLARLCRELPGRSWLTIVTRRDVGEGFRPDRAAVSIRPSPLDQAAAARLAQRMGATETLPGPQIDALAARAGGNPLFLRGLLLAAIAGDSVDVLPDTVEALITSQLDRLPPQERTALRYASVLGMRCDKAALRALLGTRALPESTEAMHRMAAFIREHGDSLSFVHQLVRDTAYETLPFRTRRALHGTAGDLLEADSANPDDIAEVLSLHFTHADRPDQAWHYARIGGERAAQKYAYVQAEELFARAVQAARRLPGIATADLVATNIALGDARFRIGRQHDALEPYRAARRASSGDPARAALLLRREAEIEFRLGRLAVALGKLTRGLRMLRDTDPAQRAARSRIESFYAVVRHAQGRYRDALSWARRAEADARSSGDLAAQAEALQAVLSASAMLGDTSHASSAQEAIALYARLGDRSGQSRALNNLAMLTWMDGCGSEALEMFRQAQQLATDAGDAVKAAAAEYNVADALLRLGRADEARTLLTALVPLLRSVGLEEYAATATRALGTAMALTGARQEGTELLHRARARLDELGEPAEVLEADAALAWAALEAGEPADAATVAAAAVRRAEGLGIVELLPWLLRLQAAARADLGESAEAQPLLHRALELAGTHSRVERGFVLAELSRLAGSPDEAADYARRAEAAFAEFGFVGSRRYPRRGSRRHEPRILHEQHGQRQRT